LGPGWTRHEHIAPLTSPFTRLLITRKFFVNSNVLKKIKLKIYVLQIIFEKLQILLKSFHFRIHLFLFADTQSDSGTFKNNAELYQFK
jgi:hypothetical protein